MRTALIVVDVQNDFCPRGALAVQGGETVAADITAWLAAHRDRYQLVVATMDWHPVPDPSHPFAHFADEPDYESTWPPHCVQHTPGAELHPGLALPDDAVIVRKGQHSAAYSGFEGHDDDDEPLVDILRGADVQSVEVVGLATDHCVRATALDAAREGFDVHVLGPLTAGVARDSTIEAVAEMTEAGISVSR